MPRVPKRQSASAQPRVQFALTWPPATPHSPGDGSFSSGPPTQQRSPGPELRQPTSPGPIPSAPRSLIKPGSPFCTSKADSRGGNLHHVTSLRTPNAGNSGATTSQEGLEIVWQDHASATRCSALASPRRGYQLSACIVHQVHRQSTAFGQDFDALYFRAAGASYKCGHLARWLSSTPLLTSWL
ncbi:hypothetical protein NDU88_004324 [Pleurodeles waltl]|uniref:Uncharacterized protein n=1 Tax=Pleurodeles waltl TaxID=8319 RepID=A0AAV7SIF8_PLEWA|nr:hypothetical protein NDU88_004324 [Pleurodeles waltl]